MRAQRPMNMRRSLLHTAPCVLLLGLAVVGWADDLNLATDSRLSTKISIRLKMTPIGEALKAISKKASIAAEATSPIKDLKVNVFATDQSVGSLLSAIGSVLHATWKDDNGVFRLSIPSEFLSKDKAILAKEDKAIRDAAQKDLESRVQNLDALPQADSTLLRTMQRWGGSEWQAFWNGEPAVIQSIAPMGGGGRRRGNAPAGPAQSAIAWYDLTTGRVNMRSAAVGPRADMPIGLMPTEMRAAHSVTANPVPADYAGWSQALPEDSEILDSPLTQTPQVKSPYSNGLVGISDVLEALTNNSKISVVSDAFRVPLRSGALPTGQTARQWIQSLSSNQGAMVRYADGVVQVRHPGFWDLRRQEVPESALRPLEAISSSKLTLDDIAAFASKLTEWQLTSFKDRMANLVRFDNEPLARGYQVLPFYGLLSSGQKRNAQAANGLPFAQLTATQRVAAAKAFLLGPFTGALGSGAYARYCAPIATMAANPNLGLLIQPTDVQSQSGLAGGVRIFIGGTLTDGVAFSVPAPRRVAAGETAKDSFER